MQDNTERNPDVGRTPDHIDPRILASAERTALDDVAALQLAEAEAEAAGVDLYAIACNGWADQQTFPAIRRWQFAGMAAAAAKQDAQRAFGQDVEVDIIVDPTIADLPTAAAIDRRLAYRQQRERAAHQQRLRREIQQADRELRQFPEGEPLIGYFALCARTREACRTELDRLTQRPRQSTTPRRAAPRPRGAGRPRASATRSSVRSGDSGDDGEPHETPPRLCHCGCGENLDLAGKRAGAKWFTDACRMRAVRSATDARSDDRWRLAMAAADKAAALQRTIARKASLRRTKQAESGHHAVDNLTDELAALLHELTRERALQRRHLGGREHLCDGHYSAWPDDDGDPVCIACGRHHGRISARLNGYELHDATMRARPHELPERMAGGVA